MATQYHAWTFRVYMLSVHKQEQLDCQEMYLSYPKDNIEERRSLLEPKIYFHSTQAAHGWVCLQASDKPHGSTSPWLDASS